MAIVYRADKGQALDAIDHDGNLKDLDERPEGQVYPKEKSIGIKLDTLNPDWGWEDMEGIIEYEAGAITEPTLELWNGNIKKRVFDVGDECFITSHFKHWYAPNTDVFYHVHWSHNSATLTTGSPKFVLEGTYAKGHNQQAFGTPFSVIISEPASTTKLQHMVTEVQISNAGGLDGLLDTAILETDGILECRLYLDSNTMDGDARPFFHQADGHLKSTGLPTKNKTPDFWT